MIELPYLLAVFSSIAYGAADFFGGLASKRSAVVAVVIFSQLAGLILVLLALPFLPPSSPSVMDMALGAGAGLAGGVGVALLYRALSVGVMSVVAPVTAVCAVVIPIIVGVALGERPTTLATIGVILAIVAIVLVSQSGEKHAAAGVPLAIAAGVAVGIFLLFLGRDLATHPDRLAVFPASLLDRARAVTSGIVIDHEAPIEGAVVL